MQALDERVHRKLFEAGVRLKACEDREAGHAEELADPHIGREHDDGNRATSESDLAGAYAKKAAMPATRRILHGRQENQTIHDENGMRHYYDEWGRWMQRLPNNPESPWKERSGSYQPAVAAE